jgi:hypothetical protein
VMFYLMVKDVFTANLMYSASSRGGTYTWAGPLQWILPLNSAAVLLVVAIWMVPILLRDSGKQRTLAVATVAITILASGLGIYREHVLEVLESGAIPANGLAMNLAPYLLVAWPALFACIPTNSRRLYFG